MASFRLNKVAKDFNVGIQTLVDYLAKKGHQVEASPNTKISDEQYELLANAFQSERMVKQEADKIELTVSGGNRVVEVSAKPDTEVEPEEVIIKGYTAPKATKVVEPEPEPEPDVDSESEADFVPAEEPVAKQSVEEEPVDAPVADPNSPFKVVGKVDLASLNQRTISCIAGMP